MWLLNPNSGSLLISPAPNVAQPGALLIIDIKYGDITPLSSISPLLLPSPQDTNMLSSTSQLFILAAALGFGSHLLFFRIGEHHKSGLLYFQLVVAAVPALLPVTVLLTHASLLEASKVLFQTECVFLLSLSFSITLYRFSPYHRLAAFPGPWMWRWTKLTQAFANRHSRGFEALDRLHQRYGEYVRIG